MDLCLCLPTEIWVLIRLENPDISVSPCFFFSFYIIQIFCLVGIFQENKKRKKKRPTILFWFLRCKAVRSSCSRRPNGAEVGAGYSCCVQYDLCRSFVSDLRQSSIETMPVLVQNQRRNYYKLGQCFLQRFVTPIRETLWTVGPAEIFLPETRALVFNNWIDPTTSAFFLHVQLAEEAFGITHALSLSFPLAVDDTNTSHTSRTDLLKNTGNVLNLTQSSPQSPYMFMSNSAVRKRKKKKNWRCLFTFANPEKKDFGRRNLSLFD